jgi:hypothetical protein
MTHEEEFALVLSTINQAFTDPNDVPSIQVPGANKPALSDDWNDLIDSTSQAILSIDRHNVSSISELNRVADTIADQSAMVNKSLRSLISKIRFRSVPSDATIFTETFADEDNIEIGSTAFINVTSGSATIEPIGTSSIFSNDITSQLADVSVEATSQTDSGRAGAGQRIGLGPKIETEIPGQERREVVGEGGNIVYDMSSGELAGDGTIHYNPLFTEATPTTYIYGEPGYEYNIDQLSKTQADSNIILEDGVTLDVEQAVRVATITEHVTTTGSGRVDRKNSTLMNDILQEKLDVSLGSRGNRLVIDWEDLNTPIITNEANQTIPLQTSPLFATITMNFKTPITVSSVSIKQHPVNGELASLAGVQVVTANGIRDITSISEPIQDEYEVHVDGDKISKVIWTFKQAHTYKVPVEFFIFRSHGNEPYTYTLLPAHSSG